MRSSICGNLGVEHSAVSADDAMRRHDRVRVPLEAIREPLPHLGAEHRAVLKFRTAPAAPLAGIAVLRVGLHLEAALLLVLEIVSPHHGWSR